MGTTRTALTSTEGCEVCFTLLIEGYGRVLTSCEDASAVVTAYAATEWSAALTGLRAPDNIGQRLEVFTDNVDSESISLVVQPDAADTFGIEAHQTALATGEEAYLEADLDPDDTTITVDDTTGFDDPGTIYIGTERITYTVTNGTTLEATARGLYAPYKAESETEQRFGRTHKLTQIQGVTFRPRVTSYPRTWAGKMMRLLAHRVTRSGGSVVVDTFAQAETIFAGYVDAVRDGESGNTVIDCVDIRSWILDQMVFADQYRGTVRPGLYLSADAGHTVTADDSGTVSTLTVVSGAPADATEITEGYYSFQQLIDSLNAWLNNATDAGDLGLTHAFDRDDTGELGTRCVYTAAGTDVSATSYTIRVIANFPLFKFLGLEGAHAAGAAGVAGVAILAASTRSSTTTSVRMTGVSTPLRTIAIQLGGDEDEDAPLRVPFTRLEVVNQTGSWVEVSPNDLPSGFDQFSSGDWGLVKIQDVILAGKFDSANNRFTEIQIPDDVVSAFLGVSKPKSYKDYNFYGTTTIDDTGDVEVRQVVVLQNEMYWLISQMMYSTGAADYNLATFDDLDYQLSIGCPYEILKGDAETFAFGYQLASLQHVSQSVDMTVVLDKPIRFKEILLPELVLRMASLIVDNGYLTIEVPVTPGSATTHTLNTSNKATPGDSADANRSRSARTGRLIRDKIEVKFNRALDGKYRSERVVVSATALSDHGGVSNPITIKARNTVGGELATNAAIESQIAELASASMGLFDGEVTEVHRSIDRTLFHAVPGQTVALTDDSVRNPLSGARGITSYPCFIEAIEKDWSQMVGQVTLILFPLDDQARYTIMSPSAQLSGYDTGTGIATVRENVYSLASGDDDVTHFAAGDLVRFIELSPADPSAPSTWVDEIDSISGNAVTTVSNNGSGTYDSGLTYVMVSDDYTTATANQGTDVYLASATDSLIQNAARGRFWTRQGLVSNLIYGTNLAALHLESSSSQYVYLNDEEFVGLDGMTDLSVQFDVRFDTIQADQTLVGIRDAAGVTHAAWFVRYASGADQLIFGVHPGAVGALSAIYALSPVKCRWYNIACTLDGSATTAKIYVNGVLVETNASHASQVKEAGSSARFAIGRARSSSAYFDGDVDNVAVWSGRVLTADEVRQNMYRELNGNEDGLSLYATFNESLTNDRTGNHVLRTSGSPTLTTTVPWSISHNPHRYPAQLSDAEGEPLSTFALTNAITTANNLVSYKTAPQQAWVVGDTESSNYEYTYASSDSDVWRLVAMLPFAVGPQRISATDRFTRRMVVAPHLYRAAGTGTIQCRVTFSVHRPSGSSWDDVTFREPYQQLTFSTSSTTPFIPCPDEAPLPIRQRDGRAWVMVELKADSGATAALLGLPTMYYSPMVPG